MWAIWDQEFFGNLRLQKNSWKILEVIVGATIGKFLVLFLVIVWISIWTFVGQLLGTFWDQMATKEGAKMNPRWGQDGAKSAQRWAKTAQDGAKMGPWCCRRWPPRGPGVDDDGRPKPPRKSLKNGAHGGIGFGAQNWPQNWSKNC